MKLQVITFSLLSIFTFTFTTQAREKVDIPDWTLGAGYGYTTGLRTPAMHFKLHHVFSNLISGGPEFTYQMPLGVASTATGEMIYNKMAWELDFIGSTFIHLSKFTLYPMIGVSINHVYYRNLPGKEYIMLDQMKKDMAVGAVVGFNLQYPVKLGSSRNYLAPFIDYRYSTNRLGQHCFFGGVNFFFSVKKQKA